MATRKYPKELFDRGVRLAIESGRPVAHVAAELGLPAETLRKRVRQAEADQGLRPDLPSTVEREEIRSSSVRLPRRDACSFRRGLIWCCYMTVRAATLLCVPRYAHPVCVVTWARNWKVTRAE